MMALPEMVFTQLVMLLLAIVALPMDDDDTMRIDVVADGGVETTLEVEHSDSTYTFYEIDGDERRDAGSARKADGEGRFDVLRGGEVVESVDFGELLEGEDLSELPEIQEKRFSESSEDFVLLQRSGELLYLTGPEQTMVVRKR